MHTHLPTRVAGATPRFYSGNSIGCLILHGFHASPDEVAWLGEHLHAQGYTVLVPCLPGHGSHIEAMRRVRWQDWYLHTLDAYETLREQCDHVVVIGHSMGGALGALLAVTRPIAGLVLAGAPFQVSGWRIRYAHLISPVFPYRDPYKGSEAEQHLDAVIRAERERRGEPSAGRLNYRLWANRAYKELADVLAVAHEHLPHITAPTLLLYATGDRVVPITLLDWLAGLLTHASVERYSLADGGHIIFQDVGREEAFAAVAAFVARVTPDRGDV